jgi:Family of unknown function (DUF6588)
MSFRALLKRGIPLLALLACIAAPLSAQIEGQLSAYTGKNASGYLQPLADAFGADLNSGIFRVGSIPKTGLTVRLELQIMGVIFADDDRTFSAITERGFTPEKRVSAPTVVGSEKAAVVEGDGGTSFAFPGGFNLNSFAVAVPQLRIGSIYGTQAIFRYFSVRIGDEDLGKLGLFGFGLRHSISQYLGPEWPVDLAAGFFWQKFTVGKNEKGDNLISSNAFSMGVQASKRFVRFVVPYSGLSYDTHSMDVSYESKASGSKEYIDIAFDKTSTMHFTLGLMLDFPVLNLFGEYGFASHNSFSFGMGFGYGI